jgi:hypothetical protein
MLQEKKVHLEIKKGSKNQRGNWNSSEVITLQLLIFLTHYVHAEFLYPVILILLLTFLFFSGNTGLEHRVLHLLGKHSSTTWAISSVLSVPLDPNPLSNSYGFNHYYLPHKSMWKQSIWKIFVRNSISMSYSLFWD